MTTRRTMAPRKCATTPHTRQPAPVLNYVMTIIGGTKFESSNFSRMRTIWIYQG